VEVFRRSCSGTQLSTAKCLVVALDYPIVERKVMVYTKLLTGHMLQLGFPMSVFRPTLKCPFCRCLAVSLRQS
jgi:hypothetical protein